MEKPVRFTKKAVKEIKRKAEAMGTSLNDAYLRIGITAVTCCGISYLLEFTSEKGPDDFELEVDGIRILIDNDFCPLLEDAEMDYIVAGDLQKTGLTIKNPNAGRTCGCSRSHSADGEKS